ncbi:MAG: tetratricopeptide repeat protein [Pseudonocardiales bacterium]|nr:tetratricopeptide repeat protein [Pseudonocardiales bacterium]
MTAGDDLGTLGATFALTCGDWVSGGEQGWPNRMEGRARIAVPARDVLSGGLRREHRHGQAHTVAAPRQVPAPSRHFTNQVRVLAAADQALAAAGEDGPTIVVFRGPPGVGKRETARFWLHKHAEQFPDGHFHADLGASVEENGLESTKLREFLLAVGHDPQVVPDSAEGRAAWFRSWSSGKRVAVSVDKALTPRQVRMLAPGPGPSVMVVTEAGPLAALGVSSAVTFINLEPLEEPAARELFSRLIGEERAAAEPDAVAAVVRICAGFPIALSVVGALLGTFPSRRISRLVTELDDEKRRLQAMSRDAELSVTAVFNTAYQRLSAVGKRCYQVMGLHPGTADFGIDVLVAALGLPEYDVRDAVDELVVVGLVREISDDRYLLHSLVRLHATGLAESTDPLGDQDSVLARMLDFYRRGAVSAGHAVMPHRGWRELLFPDLRVGNHVAAREPWGWLETERQNLSAAVRTAYQQGDLDQVCQLCVMLWPLHERGKYFEDLIRTNELGVDAARQLGNTGVAALLGIQLGFPYLHQGDAERAYVTFSAALEPARACGHRALEASAVESMGLARIAQGMPEESITLLRQNLALAEQIGFPRRTALAQLHLAKVESPPVALQLLQDAGHGFLSLDPPDTYNAAKVALWQGRRLTELGRFDDAERQLAEALATMTEHRKPFDRVQILEAIGDLAGARARVETARERYGEALTTAESYGFAHDAERLRGKISGRCRSAGRDVQGAPGSA